jgi:4-hydroxy-3-methylbut-2-enyl diphosphate reductase
LIHNPQVVEELRTKGVRPLEDFSKIKSGTVIIRSHGIAPQVVRQLRSRGITIVDATCPFVKKAQRRAAELVKEGYELVVVGEREHPEITGILAHAGGDVLVVENKDNLKSLKKGKRIGVVVQTTQPQENLIDVVSELLKTASEIKIYNTICGATQKRQKAARELASGVDLMIVVGGKNSANTSRLTQICREKNRRTYHIETADEIKKEWFKGVSVVGVTAGASTPAWILKQVIEKISSI